jgi:hypothetical protein
LVAKSLAWNSQNLFSSLLVTQMLCEQENFLANKCINSLHF